MNYAALARAWQAHALWCLGYPQQAQKRGLDAVKMVQDLDQPFNQALVTAYLALLLQLCAEEVVAREHAEQALALTSKYQSPYYRAWADILVSYALALEQPDEGASGACAARLPPSKHRAPACVCRITSRCSRRSMGKPGALGRA